MHAAESTKFVVRTSVTWKIQTTIILTLVVILRSDIAVNRLS